MSTAAASQPMTCHRWVICALLFFATTINYVDRQVIGILKPTLSAEFGWSETDYADIVFWFQAAYALGLLLVGRLIDRVGVKWGYALAVAVWSLFGMAHAAAFSIATFAMARFGLGLGEAGNFPAAVRATADWFPKKERAFATGIFNSGSNVGAILTPLLVPIIVIDLALGWQGAFIITGALGFVWLVAWWLIYREPEGNARVNAAELAHIRSDPVEATTPIAWSALLKHRQTWAFATGKFLTDPIWWFFLFWLPDFFGKNYGLDLKSFGPALIAIYLLADVGSIAGGWFSSFLIKRGWSVNAGRKSAMLVCAVCVLPVSLAIYAENLVIAVGIIGLAAAAHQGWSANLFTLASDLMPRRAVASVVGLGGMAGAVGGMLMAKYAGYVLENVGSYTPIFLLIGSMYLIALAVIHVLVPRLDPARIEA
ncbi:MFS transporter [Porphyrobacter sp. HT-58-2]|uniref:MFS transporter n=1 Tax=Porphyrobacter sp. HT-58-2 TaxID=2023229 RepID=UPI000CDC03BC|nr:MFS transporter [Porphyrobacter sp. HT-58-2]AUX68906.1 MFS transporter [Porphyrobacter sp. HT-58-2]